MNGGNLYATSDERFKNFVGDIEIDFEKLAQIPKKYYTWKYDRNGEIQIGTSAQKLNDVYPELVCESNEKLAVSYDRLAIIALAAIDKLYQENLNLKDRLKKIEEKLGL